MSQEKLPETEESSVEHAQQTTVEAEIGLH